MSAAHRSALVSAATRRRAHPAALGHRGRMRLDEVILRLREQDPPAARASERSGRGLTTALELSRFREGDRPGGS
jgi:hypothetical protein